MTDRRHLLIAAGCLLAGCGSSQHPAAKRATSARATTRGSAIAERTAAARFARAYVRYLDGAGALRGLPAMTPNVQALAVRAGAIPASRRRGRLVLSALDPAVGVSHSYLLGAKDHAHTFYAQLTLALQHGQWEVVALTPPDFVQSLAPAGPGPPPPPPGAAAPEAAAWRFLAGYLPWLYGQTPLRTVSAAASGLLSGLTAHPPRVPLTMQTLRPQVSAIAMGHRGERWQALANISDGHETYELVLTLIATQHGWLVSNVRPGGL